jgi:hypothetical protein
VPRSAPGRPRVGARPILAALSEGSLPWEPDQVLRCAAAGAVPGVPDPDTVWPRRKYERLQQLPEYELRLDALRRDWRDYLTQFVGLDPQIVTAVT